MFTICNCFVVITFTMNFLLGENEHKERKNKQCNKQEKTTNTKQTKTRNKKRNKKQRKQNKNTQKQRAKTNRTKEFTYLLTKLGYNVGTKPIRNINQRTNK